MLDLGQIEPGLDGIAGHFIGYRFVSFGCVKNLLADLVIVDGEVAFFSLVGLFHAIECLMVKAEWGWVQMGERVLFREILVVAGFGIDGQ